MFDEFRSRSRRFSVLSRPAGRPLVVHIVTVPQSTAFLAGQLRYLAARGLDVVCVSSPGEQLETFAAREGIVTYPIPMERRISPGKDLRSLLALIVLFARLRPSVVHAHTPKAGLLGMTAAWITRVPVRIFHVHGLPVLTAVGPQRRVLMATDRLSARLAHRVLFVSRSLQAIAVDLGVTSDDKTQVLAEGSPNGVDAEARFNPSRWRAERSDLRMAAQIPLDDLVVGYVGRLVRDKGVLDLLEAWELLHAPGRRLLLVGPAEEADELPAKALASIENNDGIIWVPWTDSPEAMLSIMDVLVLPSYREGLGMSLLEGSAMGLPLVATDIPGIRDAVVDGATGTLVPPRSPERLSESIEAYLLDPGLRERHGAAGRARVLTSFRPEDIWQALVWEYKALLHPFHGPRIRKDSR